MSPSDWQHHTTADSTDDQLSQGSESPTLETCLDETDAENSTRYRLVWSGGGYLSHMSLCVYQPQMDERHGLQNTSCCDVVSISIWGVWLGVVMKFTEHVHKGLICF